MKTSPNMLMAVLATALVVATLGMVSDSAHADEVTSVQVTYADLDLTTVEGSQALYRRIATAARHVCPTADGRNVTAVSISQQCQKTAIENALQAVKEPTVAATSAKR